MKNNTLLLFAPYLILNIYAMEETPEIILDETPRICAQTVVPSDTPCRGQAVSIPFCTICYEAHADVTMVHLACGHQFCKKCMSRWHFERNAHTTCPLCRAPVSPITLAACNIFDDAGHGAFAPSHQPPSPLLQRACASDNYCSILCCCCLNQTGQARPVACMSEYCRQHFCTNTPPEKAYEDCSACCCVAGCMAVFGTGLWTIVG